MFLMVFLMTESAFYAASIFSTVRNKNLLREVTETINFSSVSQVDGRNEVSGRIHLMLTCPAR